MLLTAPLHHYWTFIHQWNIVRSWGLSSLPSHSSFLSFLLFLVVALFLLEFLVWVSKQNVSRETQRTEFKMRWLPLFLCLPTFCFLLKGFFFFLNYYLTKVIKGRTNQRGLSAPSLQLTLLFLFDHSEALLWFLIFFLIIIE